MYWFDRLCHYVSVHPSPDIFVSSCNLRTSRCCMDVLRPKPKEYEVWDYFVSSVSMGNIYESVWYSKGAIFICFRDLLFCVSFS
jgi:hypothetical protein